MKHPLDWIPGKNRKPLFWIFLWFNSCLLFLFQSLNRPLMTPAAPSGIISLQLAWTPGNAQSMLDSWDPDAQFFAAFGLGFDYLFMPAYALALALGSSAFRWTSPWFVLPSGLMDRLRLSHRRPL